MYDHLLGKRVNVTSVLGTKFIGTLLVGQGSCVTLTNAVSPKNGNRYKSITINISTMWESNGNC